MAQALGFVWEPFQWGFVGSRGRGGEAAFLMTWRRPQTGFEAHPGHIDFFHPIIMIFTILKGVTGIVVRTIKGIVAHGELRINDFVKSRNSIEFVIPACMGVTLGVTLKETYYEIINTLQPGNDPFINFPASIQDFQSCLDSAFRWNIGVNDFRKKLLGILIQDLGGPASVVRFSWKMDSVFIFFSYPIFR